MPLSRPAGALAEAAVLPSKMPSTIMPMSCANNVRSDNSTLVGAPLASSRVKAVIAAAYLGLWASAEMISAPT